MKFPWSFNLHSVFAVPDYQWERHYAYRKKATKTGIDVSNNYFLTKQMLMYVEIMMYLWKSVVNSPS